jgi:hypothetical protein
MDNDIKALATGIDTLEMGYCVSSYNLSEDELKDIEFAKAKAQSTLYAKGTGIKFQGYDFMVLRTGSGRYRFILSNDDLDICLAVDTRSGRYFPELKVRFKSQLLWRNGYKAAIENVDKWIRMWANVVEVKISRVDITTDFNVELPELTHHLKEVVMRPRKKTEFGRYETYIDGYNTTGYRFGQHDLMCRIYDKTKEILRSDKKWFEELWKKNGWETVESVTRVEFQCGRKLIKEMRINTINDLYLLLPDLWKYLTNDWLTIRVIENDSHRTRWSLTKFWQTVQNSELLFGQSCGVSRMKQLRAKSVNLENNARGYALNMIALACVSIKDTNMELGIEYFESRFRSWIVNPNFEEEIKKRMLKYEGMVP